jgi:hypothetical protein
VRYTGIVEPGSKAAFILTPADEQPGLSSAYRGQDFSITMETQWPNTLIDWLRWAVFRRVPQAPEQIILWARGDLFADGKASPIPAVTP